MSEEYFFTGQAGMRDTVKPKLPRLCPVCNLWNQPTLIMLRKHTHYGQQKTCEAMAKCAACLNLYVAEYYDESPYDEEEYRLLRVFPKGLHSTQFESEIETISPMFVKIYNQAETAQTESLDEIAGPGFRKALEYLVKDYSKKLKPEESQGIESATLNTVIKDHIEDNKIKTCAERAVWLGNDETHYLRKWDEHDVEDLKTLIKLTVNFIQSEALMSKYQQQMPEAKKTKEKDKSKPLQVSPAKREVAFSASDIPF